MRIKPSLFIIFIIALSACKTQKQQLGKFASADLDFDYFTSKTKIHFSGPDNNMSVMSNIRAQKDEVIWLSIHKIGREFVRVKFTPDSVKLLDKYNKVYMLKNYAMLSGETGIELNFEMVQNMLFGNLPYQQEHNGSVGKEGHFRVYRQNSERFDVDNFVNDSTQRLEKFVVREKNSMNNMEVVYSDFEVVNEKLLASLMNLEIFFINEEKEEVSISIELKHLKPDFTSEKQNFPFTIPDSYERE